MNMLIQVLRTLLATAPELLPVVTGAITKWGEDNKRVNSARNLIRKISETEEDLIDAKIDAEAAAARKAAGLKTFKASGGRVARAKAEGNTDTEAPPPGDEDEDAPDSE